MPLPQTASSSISSSSPSSRPSSLPSAVLQSATGVPSLSSASSLSVSTSTSSLALSAAAKDDDTMSTSASSSSFVATPAPSPAVLSPPPVPPSPPPTAAAAATAAPTPTPRPTPIEHSLRALQSSQAIALENPLYSFLIDPRWTAGPPHTLIILASIVLSISLFSFSFLLGPASSSTQDSSSLPSWNPIQIQNQIQNQNQADLTTAQSGLASLQSTNTSVPTDNTTLSFLYTLLSYSPLDYKVTDYSKKYVFDNAVRRWVLDQVPASYMASPVANCYVTSSLASVQQSRASYVQAGKRPDTLKPAVLRATPVSTEKASAAGSWTAFAKIALTENSIASAKFQAALPLNASASVSLVPLFDLLQSSLGSSLGGASLPPTLVQQERVNISVFCPDAPLQKGSSSGKVAGTSLLLRVPLVECRLYSGKSIPLACKSSHVLKWAMNASSSAGSTKPLQMCLLCESVLNNCFQAVHSPATSKRPAVVNCNRGCFGSDFHSFAFPFPYFRSINTNEKLADLAVRSLRTLPDLQKKLKSAPAAFAMAVQNMTSALDFRHSSDPLILAVSLGSVSGEFYLSNDQCLVIQQNLRLYGFVVLLLTVLVTLLRALYMHRKLMHASAHWTAHGPSRQRK